MAIDQETYGKKKGTESKGKKSIKKMKIGKQKNQRGKGKKEIPADYQPMLIPQSRQIILVGGGGRPWGGRSTKTTTSEIVETGTKGVVTRSRGVTANGDSGFGQTSRQRDEN